MFDCILTNILILARKFILLDPGLYSMFFYPSPAHVVLSIVLEHIGVYASISFYFIATGFFLLYCIFSYLTYSVLFDCNQVLSMFSFPILPCSCRFFSMEFFKSFEDWLVTPLDLAYPCSLFPPSLGRVGSSPWSFSSLSKMGSYGKVRRAKNASNVFLYDARFGEPLSSGSLVERWWVCLHLAVNNHDGS